MKSWKLIKNYKGVEPNENLGGFFVRDNDFVCVLPFSGEIIFPVNVMESNYFSDYFEENFKNKNDNLWEEIIDKSDPAPSEITPNYNVINLIPLKRILKKYNILKKQKTEYNF